MYKRRLKPDQLDAISTAKRTASRTTWSSGHDEIGVRVRDVFSLKKTCRALKVNLLKLARNMHREEGGTINVLIEGCGMSTVGEELVQRAREEGIKVRVVKTDLYSPEEFRRLAEERGNLDAEDYHQLTPEELHKLGENTFHIVISRSAGLTYTKLPKLYGLENVWHVLRPKGEAHILTENASFMVYSEGIGYVSGSTIKLTDYTGAKTPEGDFLDRTDGLHYQEDSFLSHPILRIKKQEPFQDFFPPDDKDFVPTFSKIETREDAEAHQTIFHMMEEPPIEMTEEDFESLRTHTRSHEIGCLGQAGKSGGVSERGLWPGLTLVLRYGCYYLVAIDEFGLKDKILWSEKTGPASR